MSIAADEFDVLIVGGGHAGAEAALAASRLGARTLLLTMNLDHIAQMSCNPAVGGIAKGQVVREIDALGGEMARNTDAACIQFRMLNQSKGPAVRSPRAQCDKLVYQRRMQQVIERQKGLWLHQAQVTRFITRREQVLAVETDMGETLRARCFVITPGTFPNGVLHYGLKSVPGGRAGDPAAAALADSLREDLRLATGRLKTGTPPRVPADTIDFTQLEQQRPDAEPYRFSFRNDANQSPVIGGGKLPQQLCYTTLSTPQTAETVRENLHLSPMYSGRIEGVGTRYCPSFEDKVVRFPHHPEHTIHLEPEGVYTTEFYLNGISTSLPPDVQIRMVRTLPGLERAHLSRYAYAIEYDFVLPHQLDNSLACRRWPNLYAAGQINGTSGYEEAAAQGLVAGVNAAKQAANSADRLILRRDQAYIGVLVDDLVTKEIVEPYRLFTSRAEHRLRLRQDNADLRLTPVGYELGLATRPEFHRVETLQSEIRELRTMLQTRRKEGASLWEHLRRPDVTLASLGFSEGVSERAAEQVHIEARYEGYIARERERTSSLDRLAAWTIPADFDYTHIHGLRAEARDKLQKLRPDTLAQAARLDGVTPAEIGILQVHLARSSPDK